MSNTESGTVTIRCRLLEMVDPLHLLLLQAVSETQLLENIADKKKLTVQMEEFSQIFSMPKTILEKELDMLGHFGLLTRTEHCAWQPSLQCNFLLKVYAKFKYAQELTISTNSEDWLIGDGTFCYDEAIHTIDLAHYTAKRFDIQDSHTAKSFLEERRRHENDFERFIPPPFNGRNINLFTNMLSNAITCEMLKHLENQFLLRIDEFAKNHTSSVGGTKSISKQCEIARKEFYNKHREQSAQNHHNVVTTSCCEILLIEQWLKQTDDDLHRFFCDSLGIFVFESNVPLTATRQQEKECTKPDLQRRSEVPGKTSEQKGSVITAFFRWLFG